VTRTPDVRLAIDLGGATSAAALIARLDGRWRLLGALALPAAVPIEALVDQLAVRLGAADPGLAAELGLPEEVQDWPRLVARTGPPPRLAVLTATERALGRHLEVARRAGWSVTGASAQTADPLAMTRLILRHGVHTVLVGANDPPAADERQVLGELASLVAAAAERRADLTVVLAGAMALEAGRFQRPQEERSDDTGHGSGSPSPAAPSRPEAPGPNLILAPAITTGDPPGEPLRILVDELRSDPADGRRGAVRSIAALAAHLRRRLELVEVGYDAGLRAVARPLGGGGRVTVRWITMAGGALVPDPVDDALVDGVLRWSTLPLDRYRLRDRLGELRLAPWSEPYGDGAPLRLAAARAAVERLVAASPDLDRPVPDLTIVAGGVWGVAPGPAVGLAIADVVRRPGATQIVADHARLLGPLGIEPDEAVRRKLLVDLADDLLAPLGSVVIPGGLRAGRSAGRLVVHAEAGATELELVPGGLELVDLPPGEAARAEFLFRDTVTLGTRGRHFAVDVGGGLGGLLVDLRDVPLRLPDRADRRRELLAAWQSALWAGLDR
jgi:hypothetical protein